MQPFVPEIYAIDFGTTNSLLAAADAHTVHPPIMLDVSARDPSILRSVLYFPDAQHCITARRRSSNTPERAARAG
jgi:molecular chaperone DnaK (HSP70)